METNLNIGARQQAEGHRHIAAPVRALALLLLAIAALFLAPLQAAEPLPALFAPAPALGADAGGPAKAAAPPKGYKRARLAKLDPQVIAGPGSPLRQEAQIAADAPNLAINLFADKDLPVAITRTDYKGEGEFVAHGVVPGKAQSMVILAVNGDVLAGTISVPGEPMVKISYAGDGLHQIGEIAAEELPACGTAELTPPTLGHGDVVPAMAGDAVVVDVMFIYTTTAKNAAGGVAAMNAQIDLAVAEANACYSNSAVSLSLNLVYRGEITYTESGVASTDLTRIQSGAGAFSSVPTLRNTYGADVVTLITDSMATYAGLGYVMSPVSSGFAPYAFNVIKRDYLTGSYVYAHEVGHNMGCMHDRANASGTGAFDYSYGHHFDVSSTTYRTVMAYAPGIRVPYFSNPAVNYSSVATGIAAPATNSANNALSLSNAVPTVASFRSTTTFFNFDETSVTTTEDATNVVLTVSLTGTISTNATVAYTTSAVSATAGSDYTSTSGTLTFATNETSKTIAIPIINNSTVETNETFRVTLSSPTGGPSLGVNYQATVTIVDDDIGITLSAATLSVSEGGTNAVLTVNRSGGLTNTVTVLYATADISATAGSDYTNTSGTLTFTNGVTAQTITVPIIDDSAIETNETFAITLSSPSGATLVSPSAAIVTIVENDSSLSFATNAVAVNENGTLSLVVTRTGGTAGAVAVDYLTVDGTATAGTDFTNTSGTLTFTNGQASRTITVPLINDSSVEGNESFTLAITNATGGAIVGMHGSVAVTIRDNDSIFNFSTNAVTASESAASVALTVTRAGGVVGPATVHYAATNGTASVGSDFKALNGTLNFAAGETSKTISLQPINDTVVESDETLTVTLDTPTGEGAIGTNNVVTVTLTDDDSLIGFASSTLSVDEASTNMTLTVTRTGTLTLTNTIAFAFKAVSATSADFRGTNGVLTFAPGDTNKTIAFGIIDDSIVETNETFQVILSAPTGGALIAGTNTATVTIVETDIGLAFSAAAYSGAESAANIVLTVNRTGATNGTATVEYATADLSALAGSDYTNTSGTLTFTNGVASQTITVPLIEDSEVETNETFKVVLSNVANGIIVGSANAVVTILENDATIAFTTNAVSVSEVATNLVLTVTRTGGTNTTMTVDYLMVDGTATDAADYTATAGTLTFTNGQKSATLAVALLNDTTVEGDETFSVVLTNAVGGAVLGAYGTNVVTIKDNDSVFAVTPTTTSVSEVAGTVVINVTRTGGLVGAATVSYATTNGTATAGADYTAATGILSFAAGETNKIVTLKITNDLTPESSETFTLGLNTPTGEGALGTNSVATVTITDNDSTISFETNVVTVAESAGTLTVNVVRAGTLTLTNTVPFSFKAGSATAADFTGTNGVLTFLPNETNKTITATIINDSLIETNETFSIILGTPTGGAVLSGTNTMVVTITENDTAVSFLSSTASVWEDAANVVLTVKRTGDTTSTISVDYLTVDVTTTADSDYTNTSGTLTFTNGVTSLTVTVPIIEDAIIENDERFKLVLTNVTGGVISGTNAALVTIRENNSGFTFSSANYTGREGSNAVITLTRVGNTNTTFAATLLTAYTGNATNTDFTAVNTNLTFATGQMTLNYSIALAKDAVVDTNETFAVQIVTADAGFDAVAPTNAVVTITDNTGTLQLLSAAVSVVESATNVTLTVTRTGATNVTLSVDYVTADGTATNGLDYTGVTNTLNFAAGDKSKTISIPLLNDTDIEGNETFTVTLSNPSGAVLGTNTVGSVTILDNDSVIQLSTNALTVAESAGKLNVNVTRTGGLAAAATVHYATTNDTATAGSDYTALFGTLTFAAGETNKVLVLTILNDTAYETNESFGLVLSAPTGEATLGSNTAVTVTITDNDSSFAWETNAVTVAEDGGTVTLTVNRTGTLTLTNTLAYAIKPGSATTSDYTGTNGVLTFAPGDTNKTITIAIVNDSVVETNETFSVLLSAPTGGAILTGTNTAYVTIIDNDIGIAVASATRSVSEDATNIVLTINRLGATNGAVTIDYAFSDITATNGVDFHGTNGSLSFTNGVMSLTVDVPIVNDTEVEANETFKLTISNPTGGALLSGLTNTIVTIIEDDSSIALTTNAVSVIETATNVVLTVKRTGGTNSTVTVDFLTIDATATAGADYTATNATLTFAPGDVTKTINIPLSNDTAVEGDETFSLSITNISGTAAILGSYTNATVTIRDNDSVFAVLTNAVSVAENVGAATVTVRRTGGTVGVASVQYASANGTATAGSDYTAAIGTLNFKAGETNKTISIKITNDVIAEADETLTITLSNATGEATVSTNNVATLTILDNDFGFGDLEGSVAPITIVSLRWTPEGLPLLTIGGPIGAYVVVDASSDLAEWTQVVETTVTGGVIEFTDAEPGEGNRFYRLRGPATNELAPGDAAAE